MRLLFLAILVLLTVFCATELRGQQIDLPPTNNQPEIDLEPIVYEIIECDYIGALSLSMALGGGMIQLNGDIMMGGQRNGGYGNQGYGGRGGYGRGNGGYGRANSGRGGYNQGGNRNQRQGNREGMWGDK